MKKCSECGKENIDEAIFCADCGARLEHISNDSGSSNGNSNEGSSSPSDESDNKQKTDEGPDKMKILCCYVPLILVIISAAWAFVYHDYAESFDTEYSYDFIYFDSNSDGKLTFEEISQVEWVVDDLKLDKYFNKADTNHNGYLKGHEFDIFADYILHDDSGSSSSSSSSGSSSGGHDYSSANNKYVNDLNNQEFDRAEGYVLTCPYCGSESVYETGGYYKCAECGSNIYNPDDLELGYWEGYMELMTPIMSI